MRAKETTRLHITAQTSCWESNRHTLEKFVRYVHEQGLIPEPMALETLFPESTQRTFRA